MIGDRRGPNSLEGSVIGVSKDLPRCLPSYTAQLGMYLSEAASADRSDYYHQIEISSSRAESNCVGPCLRLSQLSGTTALASALADAAANASAPREMKGDGLAAQKPGFRGADPVLCGSFGSLFQGDHCGVEYATQAHENLLRQSGLLDDSSRVVASKPVPLGLLHDALVIDDYFLPQEGSHELQLARFLRLRVMSQKGIQFSCVLGKHHAHTP